MALQPIDLQTLFVRLSTVGREQAGIKQAVEQGQEVAGREIAQRSQNASQVVREADEVSDGPEKVEEEEERARQRKQNEQQGKREDSPSNENKAFQDPEVGQYIDVSR